MIPLFRFLTLVLLLNPIYDAYNGIRGLAQGGPFNIFMPLLIVDAVLALLILFLFVKSKRRPILFFSVALSISVFARLGTGIYSQSMVREMLQNTNKPIEMQTETDNQETPDSSKKQQSITLNFNQCDLTGYESSAKVVPWFSEGKMIGFKFSDVMMDGTFGKIGIHDGDILLQVNGQGIGSDATKGMKLILDACQKQNGELGVLRGQG